MPESYSNRCRAVLFLALALPQSACGAGWHRVEPAPGTLKERQQVQVWHRGTSTRLHAVKLTADSLSGIPYLRPTDCKSCRISLAREMVDSIRTGNPTAGFWKTVGLTLGGLVVGALVICGTSSSCQLEAD